MNTGNKFIIWVLICLLPAFGSEENKKEFEKLKKAEWKLSFEDKCAGTKWQDKWFLDGIKSKVTNNKKELTIDTADGFAVLWTKKEFKGDVRIEYEFQRVDNFKEQGVNILYIQATGDLTVLHLLYSITIYTYIYRQSNLLVII